MHSLRGAVAALLITGLPVLAAQPAFAQAKPERMFQQMAAACAAPLAETGKPIVLKTPLDPATRGALISAIFLTLHDPSGPGRWPEKEIEAAQPCAVARFEVADAIWTLNSGSGRLPVRWAGATGHDDFFFVMRGPSLSDARAWDQGGRQGLPAASNAPAYYLVGRDRGANYIGQIYDGPPSARRIADDIAELLETDRRAIAVHDPVGDAISLLIPLEDGPQAEILRPQDIAGADGFAALYVPDDHLITWGDDAAFVMRGSGFVCPRAFGTYERQVLGVYDPDDARLNMACMLESDTGWATIYVTRQPDASKDKLLVNAGLKELEKAVGVAARLTDPPQGPKAQVQIGRNWVDNQGRVQVVLFLRRGEYTYDIRQVHPKADIQAGGEALIAILNQIDLPDARTAEGWRARR